MPDVYREDELDFAATCVGVVDRDALIDGSAIEAGDVVLGFPSAGVHANGFSLVRRVLEEEDYDGPDLLAPTRLYLDVARRLRGRARAFAHVTGGGILGNLERVLPAGRSAEIDWDAWERPPVFGWLARHVDEEELRRVFNLGIGCCAVVRGGRARRARDRADRVIGVLVSGEGTNLQALIDAGLPIVAVASNKPGVRALERAEAAGIATAVFDARRLREPRGAGRRDRRVAAVARRRARRLRRLHAPVPQAVLRLLRRPDREHALRAAAASSPARIRSRTCSRPGSTRRPRRSTTSTRASTPAR